MSTYVHWACIAHDPPLVESDEFGQHNETDQMAELLKDRERLLDSLDRLGLEPYELGNAGHPEMGKALQFFKDHPHCPTACVNEYGKWTDLGHGLPKNVNRRTGRERTPEPDPLPAEEAP